MLLLMLLLLQVYMVNETELRSEIVLKTIPLHCDLQDYRIPHAFVVK